MSHYESIKSFPIAYKATGKLLGFQSARTQWEALDKFSTSKNIPRKQLCIKKLKAK